MLKTLDPVLGPQLLAILREMGHGDELAIVDANFPAVGLAQRLVRADGAEAPRMLDAICSILPLDSYVECAVHTMAVVGESTAVPEVVTRFAEVIAAREPTYQGGISSLERAKFYERAARAFAIVVTGERRLYGNILLTKGVVPPPG
jgi:L-fucose mutarotase